MQIQTSKNTFIVTVMSTRGGVTKSTNVANIGAFCSDHGLKVLMIDTDTQPTLSSYYHIEHQTPYDLVMRNDVAFEWLISKTEYPNLVIVAARPSMGKTALSLHFVTTALGKVIASDENDSLFGQTVQYFSIEIPAEQIFQRLMSMKAKISSHKMRPSPTTSKCILTGNAIKKTLNRRFV